MGEDRREVVDLETLVGQFSAAHCRSEWTHQAHLAAGAWHVDRFGPVAALARLRSGIRALNDSHGTINSDTSGYHETITRAYVRVIAGLFAAMSGATLQHRVTELIGGPLGARDALLRYYSRNRLMSPQARLGWVEPDVETLP